MSQAPDGGNPSDEGPARKRRKKRQRKRKPVPAWNSAVTGGDSPSPASHSQHAAGDNKRQGNRRKRKRGPARPGEVALAHSADMVSVVAASGAANNNGHAGPVSQDNAGGQRQGSKRWRRRKHKGKTAAPASGETLRNLRPPVQPSRAPSFDAAHASPGRNARRGQPPRRRQYPGQQSGTDKRHEHGSDPRHEARNGNLAVFAALDLGTNNCRLLMAVPQAHGRFRVVDAFSRIVRLGEGLAATGILSQQAMDRAVEALAICAAKLRSYPVVGQRLIATEACRRANNGMEFLERVRRVTGLELEIVDRETEARLAAEGCGSLVDRNADGAVLFDIGGGSSELILVDRRKGAGTENGGLISGQIAGWTSMPLGVVTLSEHHGGRDVTPSSFAAMVDEVTGHLEAFEGRHKLADIWHPARAHLLGTSGTVTTIAGVHLELPRYDRRKVDGIWLSSGQIDKVINDLVAMDYDQRALNPCIGRERADLVLAGCAILQAIRQVWPSPRLRVADRGLREGILSELMHAADAWAGDDKGIGQ
ncbi:MAG: Ppx/GppA phosphatase family protein [Nitratireductor sp.]